MSTKRATLCGAAMAVAAIGGVIFIGVAITEINYVTDHPFRYGPAKVIAWAASAGFLLAVALCLLGLATLSADRRPGRSAGSR